MNFLLLHLHCIIINSFRAFKGGGYPELFSTSKISPFGVTTRKALAETGRGSSAAAGEPPRTIEKSSGIGGIALISMAVGRRAAPVDRITKPSPVISARPRRGPRDACARPPAAGLHYVLRRRLRRKSHGCRRHIQKNKSEPYFVKDISCFVGVAWVPACAG
ncbi:hypothetical protein EVAR_62131_1 [Eumeta japonica]|uniref:Uncharacterized protein n=1 Tax=Eumeta variegata TaxID=151549 RepID=A0A4C1ZHV8_EUMVA|nr:hypothetical protein EVAR_62131_1 [Eumeta japonica]